MTRKEFIQKSLNVGIGLPFLSIFPFSCEEPDISVPEFEINFSGKVLIIGAGAAGLTAGYLLQRNNIDFEIIEASSVYGGRLKRSSQFADFPIDLGAEWIHAEPSILAEIISNPQVEATTEFVTYNPQTIHNWNGNKLKKQNWASNFYSEYKFKSTTWFGFFEQFIVPNILDKITYDSPVNQIDYSQDKVNISTSNGDTFSADRVLVTIPIKILQNNFINFTPALPSEKVSAIDSVFMGDGLKVFIEFRERFYPDMLLFGGTIEALASDSKIFYDAAFRKNATRNILGLFSINEPASAYTNLANDQKIIDKILEELDMVFEGKASENYVNHIVQNWSKEPFIQGSYSYDFEGDRTQIMEDIVAPVDQKIYFAGEALSDENQATVHGASETAYAAIERLLRD